MAFNPNETPIQKAIRLYKEGKELEAIGLISSMNIRRALTNQEMKTFKIAFEMNNKLGSTLYQQMGFDKEQMLQDAKSLFERTFIKE